MATRWALTILVAWPIIGLVTAYVMRRRGHDFFSWGVLGLFFGPLTVVVAFDVARREAVVQPRSVSTGRRGPGPLAVLVGVDGSPESEDAVDRVRTLFDERIGRLTLARVVDFESASEGAAPEARHVREQAEHDLAIRAALLAPLEPDTVLLVGEPASALAEEAQRGGYDVLVVGRRGRGLSKALLGSTASRLVREAPVPVLIGDAVHIDRAASAEPKANASA